MTLWIGIIVGSVGCYLLKLAGLSVPRRVLEHPRVERVAARVPVALLAALIATSTLADGRALVLDARAAGVAVAGAALLLRAPVLVVVAAATVTTAQLRLA